MKEITWKEAAKDIRDDWMIKFLIILGILHAVWGVLFYDGSGYVWWLNHLSILAAVGIVIPIAIYVTKHTPPDTPEGRKIIEYYKRSELEQMIMERINNEEKMSEEVLRQLVETFAISEVCGMCHKWHKTVMTTIKIQNYSFLIVWQKSLYGDNTNDIYDFQPVKI